jgi:hypothetical protein
MTASGSPVIHPCRTDIGRSPLESCTRRSIESDHAIRVCLVCPHIVSTDLDVPSVGGTTPLDH